MVTADIGPKLGQEKASADGRKKLVAETGSTGVSLGTKRLNAYQKSVILKVKLYPMNTSLMEVISRNQTAKNGVRTRTHKKSGKKNGARYTNQTKRRSGATSGRLI